MLTIFATSLSPNGRKVLAVGKQLELDPNIQIINVYSGEGQSSDYLAVNPAGKIPFLMDDDFTLTESNAILYYLAEEHGDYQLLAKNPAERAEVLSWLFWESAHWQPALSSVLSALVGHKLRPQDIPAPSVPPAWDAVVLEPLFKKLETHLQYKRYLAMDALTIADFSVAGMMTYFRFAQFPFEHYPNLHDWYKRIEELAAWRETEAALWKAI